MRALRSLVCLLVLGACATADAPPRLVRPSYNMISRTEITSFRAANLLTFIQTARPGWLATGRIDAVDVYQGRTRIGDAADLRHYQHQDFDAIEFLAVSQAEHRFPDARGRPIIVLHEREP